MTELFVDRKRVVLPPELSTTLTEENPEITRNGEFTWDVEVSLLNKINARIFKHINRRNITDIAASMDAMLVIDNRIRRGKIIILIITDKKVKFQFVAGNSELNYLAKNDRKIWELSGWGEEPAIDFSRAVLSAQQVGYIHQITQGANLVKDSKFISMSYYPEYGGAERAVALEAGKTYTFAITGMVPEINLTADAGVQILSSNTSVIMPLQSFTFTNYSAPQTFTVTFTSTITDAACRIVIGRTGRLLLKTIKVEEGNVATGWCPHVSELCNFVCAPIQVSGELINDFEFNMAIASEYDDTMYKYTSMTGKTIMQPYLLYYVNKLPELLGYTLKYNVLNADKRAKIMYLVNATDSLKYADALPDMTISEFIEAVENFFNVSFLVDKRDKTVSIHNFESNLQQKKTIEVTNVSDEFERLLDEDSKSVRLDFTKVSYDLTDTTYFKYQKLSDSLLTKCAVKEFDQYFKLAAWVQANPLVDDKYTIYRDMFALDEYISTPKPSINLFTRKIDTDRVVTLVNKFASVGTENDRELVLKIVPAEILEASRKFYQKTLTGNVITWTVPYQMPKSGNSYSIVPDQGLKDSIESGVKEVTRMTKLEVSLYMGMIQLPEYGVSTPYPFSYADVNPEFGPTEGYDYTVFEQWRWAEFVPAALTTLRLKGAKGVMADYKQDDLLDTTREYSFTLVGRAGVGADNIFLIGNKKYMPISLDHEVKIDGFGKDVPGKFYAFK